MNHTQPLKYMYENLDDFGAILLQMEKQYKVLLPRFRRKKEETEGKRMRIGAGKHIQPQNVTVKKSQKQRNGLGSVCI